MMRKNNFTLIELAIAILVLVIFAAMAFTWVTKQRKSSYLTLCMGSMKQIGTGVALYSSDSSYGVMPDRGPKARLLQSNLISDPKVFVCRATPFIKTYRQTITKGGVVHKKSEVYCSYKRTGQPWNPERGWGNGWAIKYKPNVVICGDGVLNHDGETGTLLFKDGHGSFPTFTNVITRKNFATTHVDNIKGAYSKTDRMYKYDENFDDKIHDGTWPKFETNTMLLFSEEDGADSPTLKDASPF